MVSQKIVPIAPHTHEPKDPVLQGMLRDYGAARDLSRDLVLGNHWGIFRHDFDRLIRTEELWPRFRELGLSYRFDDSCLYGNGRGHREMMVTYCPNEEARAWSFNGRQIQERIVEFVEQLKGKLDWDEVTALGESRIGRPPAVAVEPAGMRLDWNDVNQIFFALELSKLFGEAVPGRPVFLEIGAGYGAMASKLRKLVPALKCILVDLPETGAVQRYYLSQSDPDAVVKGAAAAIEDFDAAFETADYLLLPPTLAERLPDSRIDLAANIRSFMEMPVATVTQYIALIERTLRPGGRFYCANALEKSTSGDAVRLSEYAFAGGWSVIGEPWPLPWQPHIVALLLERSGRGEDLTVAMEHLRSLTS